MIIFGGIIIIALLAGVTLACVMVGGRVRRED
jgi:hypothetical protein